MLLESLLVQEMKFLSLLLTVSPVIKCICTYVRMCIVTHVCTYIRTYVDSKCIVSECMYVHINVCMHICMYMLKCTYVCMYVRSLA